ncbi:MAG: hypothetical protein ABW198_03375 [Pseudorhodoplanes sp.]|jgi:hypothetical protein
MTRKTLRDFGSDAADVAAALLFRNAAVITALVVIALIALARP